MHENENLLLSFGVLCVKKEHQRFWAVVKVADLV